MQQPRARSELQKFQGETKGIAKFTGPFHAWKAGFRECAMLARGSEYA